MFKVSTFCVVVATLLLASQASAVLQLVGVAHPPYCDYHTFCDVWVDHQAAPWVGWVDQVGNPPAFPQDEAISSSWVGTTSYTPSPGRDNSYPGLWPDDPNIPNVVVAITNLASHCYTDLVYVSVGSTVGNWDFAVNRLNPNTYTEEGFGGYGFLIDNDGANRPLISESMDIDGVFQPGETWEFVIQDYTNALGLSPAAFGSAGMVDPAVASGTIIPEPATMGLLGLGGLAVLRRRKQQLATSQWFNTEHDFELEQDNKKEGKIMKGRTFIGLVFFVAVLGMAIPAGADTHAPWPADWNNWSDPNLMVTVGNPGNAGKWVGESYGGVNSDRISGAVDYVYCMGKFEVTAGQYCAFLNAVAADDTYGLYTTNMSDPYTSPPENILGPGCNIQRNGSPGNYTYSVASDWANRPVNFVNWGDAARFCNWLTNGQPTGTQNLGTTEDGAYYLNGGTSMNELPYVTRKANARYVIPTEDEWFKAGYYKGGSTNAGYWDYPTSSDAVPGRDMADASGNNTNYSPYPIDNGKCTTLVGEFQNSASPYGTFDQGGNVEEWTEEITNQVYRGSRGGAWLIDASDQRAVVRGGRWPVDEVGWLGFRIAEVPEPATLSLLALGSLAILRRTSGRPFDKAQGLR
jgi:formylglycine-generating enzyme required for sulfatase activity